MPTTSSLNLVTESMFYNLWKKKWESKIIKQMGRTTQCSEMNRHYLSHLSQLEVESDSLEQNCPLDLYIWEGRLKLRSRHCNDMLEGTTRSNEPASNKPMWIRHFLVSAKITTKCINLLQIICSTNCLISVQRKIPIWKSWNQEHETTKEACGTCTESSVIIWKRLVMNYSCISM